MGITSFLAPAPPRKPLPEKEVRRVYPWYRWRVLESTFIGYAAYYLIRSNNLSVVAKDMGDVLHYSKSDIGSIMAITAATYGLGKFLLGAVSDRSDARKFLTFGLLITALCNFAFGASRTLNVHLILWGLNGFFQGMGWPPCGRSMGHWFSENERGLTFSIWNTAHNVGGGVAGVVAGWAVGKFGGWQYAFYVPGAIAVILAVYTWIRMVDTPQSVGLPRIEAYRNDYPEGKPADDFAERDLTTRELFVNNVLKNKFIWLLAFANFFAYVSRYSMLDWGPMYLQEMKHVTMAKGGLAVLAIEFGGIPSTILLGWVSDKLGGRRGMVATLCMIPIMVAFATILVVPRTMVWLDMAMLVAIGFFIYPVINLIVIQVLDLTSKKAIGTAAGFVGLLGYIGKVAEAQGFGMMLDRLQKTSGNAVAWHAVLYSILGCSFVAMVLLAFTWKLKPRA